MRINGWSGGQKHGMVVALSIAAIAASSIVSAQDQQGRPPPGGQGFPGGPGGQGFPGGPPPGGQGGPGGPGGQGRFGPPPGGPGMPGMGGGKLSLANAPLLGLDAELKFTDKQKQSVRQIQDAFHKEQRMLMPGFPGGPGGGGFRNGGPGGPGGGPGGPGGGPGGPQNGRQGGPPNGGPPNGEQGGPPNGGPPNGGPPNGEQGGPPNGGPQNGFQPNGGPPNGGPNGFQPNGGPPNFEQMRANMDKVRGLDEKYSKQIEAQLTDSQKKAVPDALKELSMMAQAGIPLDIIGDMKLTADQKRKIEAAVTKSQQDLQKKMEAARESGDFQSIREAMQSAGESRHRMVMAALTDSQKSLVENFMKEHPMRGPGGPGFGPGGPGGFGPGGQGGQGGFRPGGPGGFQQGGPGGQRGPGGFGPPGGGPPQPGGQGQQGDGPPPPPQF